MKRSGPLKRTKPMRRVSKPKKRPMREYLDRHGIAFDEYTLWLPSQTIHWPTPPRVTVDRDKEQAKFHREFAGSPCWWCDGRGKMELHHLCARPVRSHERSLFAWTCDICHREHVGREDFGRWLGLKWLHDSEHVDWVLTAIRYGSFLPELIVG